MNALTPAAAQAAPTQTAEAAPSLLDQILNRVDIIEAKQSRPSPVKLQTWEDIERFAEKAARSGMVPKDYIAKPDAICIAIQMGSELGLAPMQALQNIAVVNGRPSIWGDALPALCRASGICAYIREWHDGEGDALTYYCEAKRKDDPHPIRSQFSVAEAKQAGLWQEKPTVTKRGRDGSYEAPSGPWYSYRPRMLQMRARGFGLRDAFPDVLKGLITTEEARDIPFEETGLTPSLPAARQTVAQDIGDDLPDHAKGEPPTAAPKRKTWADLLDEIEADFTKALIRDEVDAVLAGGTVQKALDNATNGTRDRLNAIIKAAIDRTATPIDNDPTLAPSDTLPGIVAEDMIARIRDATAPADIKRMRDRTNAAWREEYNSLEPIDRALVDRAIAAREAELARAS